MDRTRMRQPVQAEPTAAPRAPSATPRTRRSNKGARIKGSNSRSNGEDAGEAAREPRSAVRQFALVALVVAGVAAAAASVQLSWTPASASADADADADANTPADTANVEDSDSDSDSDEVMAFFENQWHAPVSLWWENGDDDWNLVIPSIPPVDGSTRMATFLGHRFRFTGEGTRDQVGGTVEVVAGQERYVLEPTAKTLSELDPCADRFPKKCPEYMEQGECDKNPGWMIVNCPTSCDSCELLDPVKRCNRKRLNMSEAHVWQPGDLDAMFRRILADPEFAELEPRAVSQPPDGPWIVVFDKFMAPEESATLRSWGDRLGFQRSTDVGEVNTRGERAKKVSQTRTSSNTWCSRECEKDPAVEAITLRTQRVTGVPTTNYESFQLLHYVTGQKYNLHHDMSPHTVHLGGPRILTFFLYLSDVEEGGETDFPHALDGIKVKPKDGRAVLWPSVLDENPLQQDPRTFHAALPVIKGVKLAANHWLHSHDFRKANLHGCTGM